MIKNENERNKKLLKTWRFIAFSFFITTFVALIMVYMAMVWAGTLCEAGCRVLGNEHFKYYLGYCGCVFEQKPVLLPNFTLPKND